MWLQSGSVQPSSFSELVHVLAGLFVWIQLSGSVQPSSFSQLVLVLAGLFVWIQLSGSVFTMKAVYSLFESLGTIVIVPTIPNILRLNCKIVEIYIYQLKGHAYILRLLKRKCYFLLACRMAGPCFWHWLTLKGIFRSNSIYIFILYLYSVFI